MDYSREILCRVWLQCAPAASWNAVKRLIAEKGSAAAVWDAFSPDMREILGVAGYAQLSALRGQGRDKVLLRLDACGARVVSRKDAAFPRRLLTIPDAPDLLFVRGKLPPEDAPAVAVVGSRHDTRYGRAQAVRIAKALAENGVTIVSGLARGIDTAAHEGALLGGGRTVAVLGNGIERVYPPENQDLAERILRGGGAILSEYAPEAEPLPFHFPIRNRLISGLSDAVLLIEARFKSGTASTVNHAQAQGREVFALPGNVDAPGSELPLQLLRDGANLCVDENDIFSHMGWKRGYAQTALPLPAQAPDDPILRALEKEEMTFEELAALTGMPPPALSARLTLLELDGRVERRGGRAYAKK